MKLFLVTVTLFFSSFIVNARECRLNLDTASEAIQSRFGDSGVINVEYSSLDTNNPVFSFNGRNLRVSGSVVLSEDDFRLSPNHSFEESLEYFRNSVASMRENADQYLSQGVSQERIDQQIQMMELVLEKAEVGVGATEVRAYDNNEGYGLLVGDDFVDFEYYGPHEQLIAVARLECDGN